MSPVIGGELFTTSATETLETLLIRKQLTNSLISQGSLETEKYDVCR